MSYDRYVAVRHPLDYETIMTKGACGQMVVASYFSAVVSGAMHTGVTFSTTFTSNKIHTFFCDIPHIILISDSKINRSEVSVTGFTACISLACFISILYSYVNMFSAVLRISSLEGRSKALSTCLPHLIVVTLFLSTAALAYLKPSSEVLFFVTFGTAEIVILTVMSYDRYVAICHLLHYETIMNKGACGRMVVASYISVGVYAAMHTAATFSTKFISNKIHHFFCDIPQIMLISNSKTNINEASLTAFGASISLLCFLSILYSYVHIFSAVSRISSLDARSKALSTCLPHVVVVTVFLSTGAVAYLRPASELKSIVDLVLSVFYTVVPPSVNPIIYSLRNKDIQLHTPMYFFLKNLSLIDLCYISVTVPKFALNSLMKTNKISFLGCIFQVLFFVSFCSAEIVILTVMSYDGYMAIYYPLHYETIMTKGACGRMVVASYITVGVYETIHILFPQLLVPIKSIISSVIFLKLF
ncbi:Olfactory Receptor 14A16 [Manis pentadactyla]|nr:Olfactory Receptor 14A16 [Manis pentadactyla]